MSIPSDCWEHVCSFLSARELCRLELAGQRCDREWEHRSGKTDAIAWEQACCCDTTTRSYVPLQDLENGLDPPYRFVLRIRWKDELIWEGFVSPIDQGLWGEGSRIVSLPLYHVAWDLEGRSVEEVFQDVSLLLIGVSRTTFLAHRIAEASGVESVSRDNHLFVRVPSDASIHPRWVLRVCNHKLLGLRLVCHNVL